MGIKYQGIVSITGAVQMSPNRPPIWNTAEDLGSYFERENIEIVLSATDPEGGPVTFRESNSIEGQYLPYFIEIVDGKLVGELEGVPSEGGVVMIPVDAVDAQGKFTPRLFTIDVMNNASAVWITDSELGPVPANEPFSLQLEATDPEEQPITFVGDFYDGVEEWLTCSPSGLLEGTPPAPGEYSFGVNAQDGSSSSYRTFYLTVV